MFVNAHILIALYFSTIFVIVKTYEEIFINMTIHKLVHSFVETHLNIIESLSSARSSLLWPLEP